MFKTEQIMNAKFTPITAGAYSANEVDTFLTAVAESYEQLIQDRNAASKRLSLLAEKVEQYRRDEDAIKASLIDAHKLAGNIKKEARENADKQIEDAGVLAKKTIDEAKESSARMAEKAKSEAGQIINSAKQSMAAYMEKARIESERAISQANAKAQQIIAGANERKDQIIGESERNYKFYTSELKRMKREIAAFREQVEKLYNQSSGVNSEYNNEIINSLLDNKLLKGEPELSKEVPSQLFEKKAPASAATEKTDLFNASDLPDDWDLPEELPASLDDILPPPVENKEPQDVPVIDFDFVSDTVAEDTQSNNNAFDDLQSFLDSVE